MDVNWIAIKLSALHYVSCGLPTMTLTVRTDLLWDLLISRGMYNGPLLWEVQMSRRRQMVPITMAINEDANSSAIADNFDLWFDTFLSASHCWPLSVPLLFALLFRVTQRIATFTSNFLALVFVLARSCDAASSLRSAPYPAIIFCMAYYDPVCLCLHGFTIYRQVHLYSAFILLIDFSPPVLANANYFKSLPTTSRRHMDFLYILAICRITLTTPIQFDCFQVILVLYGSACR